MTLAEWLGVVGFLLSLALAVREVLRSSLRLQAVALFRGDPQQGHEVLLINRSSQPVFIYSYDVVCAKREADPEPTVVFSLEDELCDMRIESMSRAHLRFSDDHHFPWVSASKGRTFIRLWIAGRRKPLWQDLTPE